MPGTIKVFLVDSIVFYSILFYLFCLHERIITQLFQRHAADDTAESKFNKSETAFFQHFNPPPPKKKPPTN